MEHPSQGQTKRTPAFYHRNLGIRDQQVESKTCTYTACTLQGFSTDYPKPFGHKWNGKQISTYASLCAEIQTIIMCAELYGDTYLPLLHDQEDFNNEPILSERKKETLLFCNKVSSVEPLQKEHSDLQNI